MIAPGVGDDRPVEGRSELLQDSAATLRQVAELLGDLGEDPRLTEEEPSLETTLRDLDELIGEVRRASARPVTPDGAILFDVQARLLAIVRDLRHLQARSEEAA